MHRNWFNELKHQSGCIDDTSIKQEVLKDLYVALTFYDSYDSRPPNPSAKRNDVGVVASIGWTY